MIKTGTHIKLEWTEDKIAYLKEHYPDGTCGDIADALKMSAPSVKRMAHELGLKKREGWKAVRFSGRYTRNYAHNINKVAVRL